VSVTHIAGPACTINGRTIQRCQWCGEIMVDSKGQMGPVGPSGEPPQVLVYATGHLIETNGNRTSDAGECDRLPEDSCFEMVE
jgi:hypothetical protein